MSEKIIYVLLDNGTAAQLKTTLDCIRKCKELIGKILLISPKLSGKDRKAARTVGEDVELKELSHLNKLVKNIGSNEKLLLLKSGVVFDSQIVKELIRVMEINEKHGIVAARTHYKKLPDWDSFSMLTIAAERCLDIETGHIELSDFPEYSYRPFTDLEFALISSRVIDQIGFIDGKFTNLEAAWIDFSLVASRYGYSSVLANRAIVRGSINPHFLNCDKNNLAINKYLLMQKHGYLEHAINEWKNFRIHPLEHFHEVLSPVEKPKVLLSLYDLPPMYNGTSMYQLGFLDGFMKEFSNEYEIHILTKYVADRFHRLSEHYPNVVYPESIESCYTIAFSPSQIFSMEHLFYLHRYSLKFIVSILDIITLRSLYISSSPEAVTYNLFATTINFADSIVTISDFSKKDLTDFFRSKTFEIRDQKIERVYVGFDPLVDMDETPDTTPLPFERYIFVVGNEYYHKMLRELYSNIANRVLSKNFVFLGLGEDKVGMKSQNVKVYPSGKIPESFKNKLYRNADIVIFPSHYEGFGIPIVEALRNGKHVAAYRTALNEELIRGPLKEFTDSISLYNSWEELVQIVTASKQNEPDLFKAQKILPKQEIVYQIKSVIDAVHQRKVDVGQLESRWTYLNMILFRHLIDINKSPDSVISNLSPHSRFVKFTNKIRGIYNLVARMKNDYIANIDKILVHNGVLILSGWIRFRDDQLVNIEILGSDFSRCIIGVAREDVAKALNDQGAINSGFVVSSTVHDHSQGDHVTLLISLKSGRKIKKVINFNEYRS